ncbi:MULTISPECIES: transposase [unclassified Streptomyces]|uniref:transposase n=1 Tax=unclassified Streptomyces TaxID=2593676 RepID=UPI0015C4135F|nr:transposase [Streptomyces sp. 13-12-16]
MNDGETPAGRAEREDLQQCAGGRPGHRRRQGTAGRKRHIGVDTLGLLPAVPVTAASVSGNVGGTHLISHIAATHPPVAKARADTGYRTKAIGHGARPGVDVEVAPREPGVKGFKVIPRSRLVERTFGRLVHRRHLTRDHETHPPPLRNDDPRSHDRPHEPGHTGHPGR